jgi:predicted metal-dependent hydrolase
MARTHPHAEARYRVIQFDNGSFAVEVSIPDSNPTRVSTFKTEADAEAWIVEHQRRVQSQTREGDWFRGSRRRGRERVSSAC